VAAVDGASAVRGATSPDESTSLDGLRDVIEDTWQDFTDVHRTDLLIAGWGLPWDEAPTVLPRLYGDPEKTDAASMHVGINGLLELRKLTGGAIENVGPLLHICGTYLWINERSDWQPPDAAERIRGYS
jgi:hypothetical protein